MRFLSVIVLSALLCPTVLAYESGRAGFSVRVNDIVIPYRVFAIYALPGEILAIEALEPDGIPEAFAGGKSIEPAKASRWSWAAPTDPGVNSLIIMSGADEIQLNIVVMHPASAVVDGRLSGYRIGRYPREPLGGDPVYSPPDGFVELNDDTESLRLSPHFRLSQFPSKQSPDRYPKYLVLRESLLLKLELLLEDINKRGIEAETLTIMSGYRTPFYNAAIGNVKYSRHVYGGAADIYIDVAPRDGNMDDINGDGRGNYRDAQQLYLWANALFRRPEHSRLAGGLGVYRRNPAHGPFLHVDARGRRARWGLIP